MQLVVAMAAVPWRERLGVAVLVAAAPGPAQSRLESMDLLHYLEGTLDMSNQA